MGRGPRHMMRGMPRRGGRGAGRRGGFRGGIPDSPLRYRWTSVNTLSSSGQLAVEQKCPCIRLCEHRAGAHFLRGIVHDLIYRAMCRQGWEGWRSIAAAYARVAQLWPCQEPSDFSLARAATSQVSAQVWSCSTPCAFVPCACLPFNLPSSPKKIDGGPG